MAAAMCNGPVSGASMNPARSLAPAVVSGRLDHLWIYLTAPVLGAVLAAVVCVVVHGPRCCFAGGTDGGHDGCKAANAG